MDNDKSGNRGILHDEESLCSEDKRTMISVKIKTDEITMNPYPFRGKIYKNLPSLTFALAENWEYGKKELFRRSLSEFFKPFNPEVAGICMDAEEAVSIDRGSQDYHFFDTLYKLNPDMQQFYWKDISYISLSSMGRDILYKLRTQKLDEKYSWHEILGQKIISCFLSNHPKQFKNLRASVKSLEKDHSKTDRSQRDQMMDYYKLGYLLSGEREYYCSEQFFTSISQLTHYLHEVSNSSFQALEDKSRLLINYSNEELHPQLEAWLCVLNKEKTVTQWKKGGQSGGK